MAVSHLYNGHLFAFGLNVPYSFIQYVKLYILVLF